MLRYLQHEPHFQKWATVRRFLRNFALLQYSVLDQILDFEPWLSLLTLRSAKDLIIIDYSCEVIIPILGQNI